MMMLIDWEQKGNVVRLYFGDDSLDDWGGDDWNDAPYEHNADTVYGRYVADAYDVAFPLHYAVLEPKDGHWPNSRWCKDDMIARRVPCLVVLDDATPSPYWGYARDFDVVLADDKSVKFYFGDSRDECRAKLTGLDCAVMDIPKNQRWWENEED